MDLFSSDIYQRRRQQLIGKFSGKKGLILLPANAISSRNYPAITYPYRQDSTFLYFFGLSRPNLVGVIDLDTEKSYLYGESQTVDDIIWSGRADSLEKVGEQVGVDGILSLRSISEHCKTKKLYYLPQYKLFNQKLLSKISGMEFQPSIDLIQAVIEIREIKLPEEIASMEEALMFTKDLHVCIMTSLKKGMKEQELLATAFAEAQLAGMEAAYAPILTRRGEILHSETYEGFLREGDLILADIGLESRHGYAADITRTSPVNKSFDPRQKEIYTIVLETLNMSIQRLHPGKNYFTIHLQAAKQIANGLKEIGLMRGDMDEAVAQGAHALFFPHGLGHMIGLDVHDMENLGEDRVGYDSETKRSKQFGLATLRLGKSLKAGHTLTVEPGIYFIDSLIDLWESEGKHKSFINYPKVREYIGFGGIRLEDNCLITEDGYQVLGPPVPKEISHVEFLRDTIE